MMWIISMTSSRSELISPDERRTALGHLGYNAQESQFIALAALHSGYFLRRQYLAFAGGTKGWKDVQFIDKLRAKNHCRVSAYRHNRMVYHLSAKPLYAALNDPDNRNRREHQPATIKRRLMGLDFVLAHADHQYLATEREKIRYFTGSLELSPEQLPTRWYESPQGRDATAKHFVDKFPLFLALPETNGASRASAPVVHFCYVDEDTQTTDGFATHLAHYRRLLTALPEFRIIYIADHSGLFETARRTFVQALGRWAEAPADPIIVQLLDYFEARAAFEARDFSTFDTARLIRFRQEKRQFAPYEALYSTWQAGGKAAVCTALGHRESAVACPEWFSTYLVSHDFDLFGNITAYPRVRPRQEEKVVNPAAHVDGVDKPSA
jgi:hypothetical protein